MTHLNEQQQRQSFMKRCELTHVDCLSHNARLPVSRLMCAEAVSALRLTTTCFSCESCKKDCLQVAKCTACSFWVCLDSCATATTRSNKNNASNSSKEPAFDNDDDADAATVSEESAVPRTLSIDEWTLCNYCAKNTAAAASITTTTLSLSSQHRKSFRPGSTILKRVVFVLEQQWQFRMAQEILDHVFDVAPNGSALVYGMRCDDVEEWRDAFQWIRRFAAAPYRYLPDSYCYVDGQCRIDVVIGTHTARDDGTAEVDLQFDSHGNTGTLSQWTKLIATEMFTKPKNGIFRFSLSLAFFYQLFFIYIQMYHKNSSSKRNEDLRMM